MRCVGTCPVTATSGIESSRASVSPDGTRRAIPNYLTFHGAAANRPSLAQALWVYSQMVRWAQVPLGEDLARRAASAFRPDLFDAVFGEGPAEMPGAEPALTPETIGAYVERFAVRRPLALERDATERD